MFAGVFITGTDTGIGKTIVAASIAQIFSEQGYRVAVFKPAGSGCVRRREGLVSEDAELLAHCANARHPLDLICPQRYAEPLAPAVAAERVGAVIDVDRLLNDLEKAGDGFDRIVVEGAGGLLVRFDEDGGTIADVAQLLAAALIVVARAGLGTLNHTALTVEAIERRGLRCLGVVIGAWPRQPDLAAECNLEDLAQIAPVLGRIPEGEFTTMEIPA